MSMRSTGGPVPIVIRLSNGTKSISIQNPFALQDVPSAIFLTPVDGSVDRLRLSKRRER